MNADAVRDFETSGVLPCVAYRLCTLGRCGPFTGTRWRATNAFGVEARGSRLEARGSRQRHVPRHASAIPRQRRYDTPCSTVSVQHPMQNSDHGTGLVHVRRFLETYESKGCGDLRSMYNSGSKDDLHWST
ncbi:unnamed protein product [Soboliphyme baturini]|uniref:Uncharacterized protein n=1 Tax=Soboliphyme baturini TaxID=241478 RepID=A0A183J4P6_9BILA|nr:unnamed protein product [Soboliphyme baturini]